MSEKKWWKDAACREYEPAYWDGEQAGRPGTRWRRPDIALAKTVCSGCPVISQCVEDAIEGGDVWTIRGGMTAGERRDAGLHADWTIRRAGHTGHQGSDKELRREREARAMTLAGHGLMHSEIASAMSASVQQVSSWLTTGTRKERERECR